MRESNYILNTRRIHFDDSVQIKLIELGAMHSGLNGTFIPIPVTNWSYGVVAIT